MALMDALEQRCDSACELCNTKSELSTYLVPPRVEEIISNQVAVCNTCSKLLSSDPTNNPNHWRCLNESMWSQEPAVQVVVHRILSQLSAEPWASDLQGQMYLSDETMEWAQHSAAAAVVHKDCNGNILSSGDSVVLIQDLNVKGGGFTAKRGTAVRKIRLVHDNADQVEGKVDGQQIVLLTKYLKKS